MFGQRGQQTNVVNLGVSCVANIDGHLHDFVHVDELRCDDFGDDGWSTTRNRMIGSIGGSGCRSSGWRGFDR